MSLVSMTGFGRGEHCARGIRAIVEIGSVNRRQLDIQLHLPRPLQPLESRIIEEVSAQVSRGRVTLSAEVSLAPGVRAPRVRVDDALAREWVDALRETARRLHLRDDLSVSLLLQAPDVVRMEHPEEDIERAWPVLRAALRRALRALRAMRRAEGRRLAADLAARLRRLGALCEAIAERAPKMVEQYRAALLRRLREAGLDSTAQDPSVAREIALFADRSDIAEELTRLRSHLAQARQGMQAREPAGRAIDFLAQEMLREINTIASKCSDAEIAVRTVEFKAELERFREQVQNVE